MITNRTMRRMMIAPMAREPFSSDRPWVPGSARRQKFLEIFPVDPDVRPDGSRWAERDAAPAVDRISESAGVPGLNEELFLGLENRFVSRFFSRFRQDLPVGRDLNPGLGGECQLELEILGFGRVVWIGDRLLAGRRERRLEERGGGRPRDHGPVVSLRFEDEDKSGNGDGGDENREYYGRPAPSGAAAPLLALFPLLSGRGFGALDVPAPSFVFLVVLTPQELFFMIFIDETVLVDAEASGIGAEDAFNEKCSGQQVQPVVFERLQIAEADFRLAGDIVERNGPQFLIRVQSSAATRFWRSCRIHDFASSRQM